MITLTIRLALALASLAGGGFLFALLLLGRAALEFAGAALLRVAFLPPGTALRTFVAGTALPLRRAILRATLRPAAEIRLRAAVTLLATPVLRALVIRTRLPFLAAVVLPRAPARLITPAPGVRAPLRTLLQEAIAHPLAHQVTQVTPAAPLRRIAAELLQGRTHPAILTPTPSLRSALGALLQEALTHPFAHQVTQIAAAAPFLRSTTELLRTPGAACVAIPYPGPALRPLLHRAAAEILLGRAHAPAFAPTPVLRFARRAHRPLVLLRPLTRPLPLIHARTTPGRPHRAAFVVAVPGTLRRRTEGRAHQQGGGE